MTRDGEMRGPLVALVALGLVCFGCGALGVKGKGHVKASKDGKTIYEKTVEFDDLEELPAALAEMTGALVETTSLLAKELTEAPPPGEVELGDLDPALAQFAGDAKLDFLKLAKKKGDPDQFKYVRIGVPSYDQFFQASAEFYALVFQTKQAIHRMKQMAGAVLGKKNVEDKSAFKLVKKALKKDKPPKKAKGLKKDLKQLKAMAGVLAANVGSFVDKSQQLVATGQQLVTAAPSSITNPKTVLHLDLIVTGLEQSIEVIAESAKLLPQLVRDLAGF